MIEELYLKKCVDEDMSISQISEKTGESKTSVRYWLGKYGMNTNHKSFNDPAYTTHKMENGRKCIICDKPLDGRKTRFCGKKCKSKYYSKPENLINTYESQRERGLSRKKKLIEMSGGGCAKCGYAKNSAGLVFHHIDEANKCFELDIRKLSNTKWELITKEWGKCILLCHNCHMELHYPHLGISN